MENSALDEVCKNCKHWNPFGKKDEVKPGFAICSRFPPVGYNGYEKSSEYPKTNYAWTCGEFKLSPYEWTN